MSGYVSSLHAFNLLQDIPADEVAFLGAAAAVLAGYLVKGTLWNKPDPYRRTWFERPQEQHSARNLNRETRDIAQKLKEAVSEPLMLSLLLLIPALSEQGNCCFLWFSIWHG